MGLIHSQSSIVTDGLQLYLDAANYKSYTANVKNLISLNPVPSSTSSYAAGGGDGTLTYDSVNQAVVWERTGYDVWGAYLYNQTRFYGNLDTTKQYTASFEWKNESLNIANNVYVFEVADGPDLYNVASANVEAYSTSIGNGWYRFSYTFTPLNSGLSAYFRILMGPYPTKTSRFLWRKLQLEQSSSRSDFVDGSFATTWKDLSPNGYSLTNTNSAYYTPANGGALWFWGDYAYGGFTIPSSIINFETLGQSKNFTVMFGVQKKYYGYSGNSVGNSIILTGSGGGYSEGWRIAEYSTGTMGSTFTGIQRFSFGMPELSGGISVVDTVANRPAIVGFSIGTSTINAIINGVLSSSGTPSYINGVGHLGQIGASNYGVGAFAGNFHFLMIYNRALTQAELTQNYNALKGRLGL